MTEAKLYEGKAKILYRLENGHLKHFFKNSATAFNAQKRAEFEGKGELNCQISAFLFTYLKGKGIASHFIRLLSPREFESQPLTILPVEVVVRNRMAGSLAQRLRRPEGDELPRPVVEWFYKDDSLGDPLVSEDLLISLWGESKGFSESRLKEVKQIALRVNQELKLLFEGLRLLLVDFKLEFGLNSQEEIVLADEISPDTCRLWDADSLEKFDKDRFRRDLGDLVTGYQEVWKRLSSKELV